MFPHICDLNKASLGKARDLEARARHASCIWKTYYHVAPTAKRARCGKKQQSRAFIRSLYNSHPVVNSLFTRQTGDHNPHWSKVSPYPAVQC